MKHKNQHPRPQDQRSRSDNRRKKLPKKPNFGITSFKDILEMSVHISLGFFRSPKIIRELASDQPDPRNRVPDENRGSPAGADGRSAPGLDNVEEAATNDAHVPWSREIETVLIPEGTKGRYETCVTERGDIQVLRRNAHPSINDPSIVHEDEHTITIDSTIPKGRAVQLRLDPAILEDLANAAWHCGRTVNDVLEVEADLALAKLELLYNEGKPFPPRPRQARKRER